MRSTPWFQQPRSESAPPVQRPKEGSTVSAKDQEEITNRLMRPTESALYRQSLYWKLDSFMDRGFHSWSKMDLFSDSKRCMWTPHGSVKRSCKIRPIHPAMGSLPPLVTGDCTSREGEGSATSRSSLHTPATPSSHRSLSTRHSLRPRGRGVVTWKMGGASGGVGGARSVQCHVRSSLPLPPPPISRSATQYSIGV